MFSYIEIMPSDEVVCQNDDLILVFFDLETAGLSTTHQILQISMKCGKHIFNCYLTPTQSINPRTTQVNGFSAVRRKLFQNGKEVSTLPQRIAFQKVLEFLKSLTKKCVLVAHNCTFDYTRFVLAIKNISLLQNYEEIIEGFSDSLVLFRRKFPNRGTGYKLTVLASELLSLSCDGAHDAKFYVFLLEKLCVAFLDTNDFLTLRKSISDVAVNIQNNESIKSILPSFTPLKSIISDTMQKRLAGAGFTYENIVHAFKTKGLEETKALLRGDVNGKATIIKKQSILQNIINHLSTLP